MFQNHKDEDCQLNSFCCKHVIQIGRATFVISWLTSKRTFFNTNIKWIRIKKRLGVRGEWKQLIGYFLSFSCPPTCHVVWLRTALINFNQWTRKWKGWFMIKYQITVNNCLIWRHTRKSPWTPHILMWFVNKQYTWCMCFSRINTLVVFF